MAVPSQNFISTLSEIHAVLTATYFDIIKSIDYRFEFPYQVFYSNSEEWPSVKENFFRKSQQNLLKLPFATLTRVPEIREVDFGGGYRQWDVDWYDPPSTSGDNTSKAIPVITGRQVGLGYNLYLYDSRQESMERLIEQFILNATPYNQAIDFPSDILQVSSRINFVNAIPRYKSIPDKDERNKGQGSIYVVHIPILVSGFIGYTTPTARVLKVIGNIYTRNPDVVETGADSNIGIDNDTPINPLKEGDHVEVTYDTVNKKFVYTWQRYAG